MPHTDLDDTAGADPYRTETNRDLVSVHEAALEAANLSWSETDKLYVSVCSLVVVLVAVFGQESAPWSVLLVGVLVLLLAWNWYRLIDRYREKISGALGGLREAHADEDVANYYKSQLADFVDNRRDYAVVKVVMLVGTVMVAVVLCQFVYLMWPRQ